MHHCLLFLPHPASLALWRRTTGPASSSHRRTIQLVGTLLPAPACRSWRFRSRPRFPRPIRRLQNSPSQMYQPRRAAVVGSKDLYRSPYDLSLSLPRVFLECARFGAMSDTVSHDYYSPLNPVNPSPSLGLRPLKDSPRSRPIEDETPCTVWLDRQMPRCVSCAVSMMCG